MKNVKRAVVSSMLCLIGFGIQLAYADELSKYAKDVENMISKQKELYKAMTEQNVSVAQGITKEINKTGKIVAKEMISAGIKETLGPAGSLLTISKGITVAAEGLAVILEEKLNIMKEVFVKDYINARDQGQSDAEAWNTAKWGLELYFEGVKPKYNESKVHAYAKSAYELKLKIEDNEKQLLFIENYAQTKNDVINKPILSERTVINTATQEAIKYADLTYEIPYAEISLPKLAKKLGDGKFTLDSSQLSEGTPQQQVTPVSVSFTETFDGVFTQAADSSGSQGGNHSGTITSGTRIGAGAKPGAFTGSFSGRTIAEPGYTPATYANKSFSGASVGTATAQGFQEGELKGSITITVPAGTQTATLSGNITINTNGSLSMPSYSGPITVNGTGQNIGAMSGSWNQGVIN